jgi:hypothetical protein
MMFPTSAGRRTSTMLEEFESAVRARRLSHGGGPTSSRHILNARRRPKPHGMTIAKEHPRSDGRSTRRWPAVPAYEARRDAISRGLDRADRDVRAISDPMTLVGRALDGSWPGQVEAQRG